MGYPRYMTKPAKEPDRPDDLPEASIPAWLHPSSRGYLENRGLTRKEVEFYDLHYTDSGDYRNRIIIPMYDEEGSLVAYQARCLNDKEPRYLTCGPRPVYKPWDISDTGVVEKLVVVEGPFDVYAVSRIHPATVAMLGILPAERQVTELKTIATRVKAHELVLWFDHKAEKELYELQLRLQPYIRTHVMFHDGEAKDPGSLSTEAIRKALAV